MAHPTRFERVTFAFGALLLIPPALTEDIAEARPVGKMNRTHHTMQHVALPFLLGRRAPFLSMNKVPLGLDWFFALVPSA
jgi:hypothetical protein